MAHSVLIIDDERVTCDHLCRIFQGSGYETLTANRGEDGLVILEDRDVSLTIVDLKMPGMDGLSVLREAKLRYPYLPVIVMTAYGTIETAVEAMRSGASDYITKPFSSDEILIVAERAIEREELRSEVGELRREVIREYSFDNIISKNPKMEEIFQLIKTLADTNTTVAVYGETGTGKELVARAIHYNSPRRNKKFVSMNCGAVSESLLESELFGHEKGAFTGAIRRKQGRFELADGGSLFLDEIGNVSESMQVRLLRVLEEKEFERVGGTETIKSDVRIISATNKNLLHLVEDGKFREDLYYRINVVPITIPPLRERRDDVPLLASYFLSKFVGKFGKQIDGFSPTALKRLVKYPWPGNVRELENVVERAVLMTREGLVEEVDVDEGLKVAAPDGNLTLDAWMKANEKSYLEDLLAKCQGNVVQAGVTASVSVKTLYRKLAQHGVNPKESKPRNSQE